VVAKLDALVADEHRGAGDQLLHLVLALAAERAVQNLLGGGAFSVGHESMIVDTVEAVVQEKAPGLPRSNGSCSLQATVEHLVDKAVVARLARRHEKVALAVDLDLLQRLPGALRHDVVQVFTQLEDLARLDFD